MTVQPYDPNQPPRANSSIGQSQPPFLFNFMDLYNAFKQNHVALDAASGAGDHTIIQLVNQSGQFNTDVGEISVYGRQISDPESEVAVNYQLFIREQGNAVEFAYTNFQIYALKNPPVGHISYFTTLPGGLIFYFGTVFPGASGNIIELRPPICTNIISINLCPNQTTPTYPPATSILTPTKGIYQTIALRPSPMAVIPSAVDYVIIGNT